MWSIKIVLKSDVSFISKKEGIKVFLQLLMGLIKQCKHSEPGTTIMLKNIFLEWDVPVLSFFQKGLT